MENWTPAHLASKYGNIELLEVLVDRGARLEARTKRGWKPLHFAAQGGHLDCVELLLRERAMATCVTKERLSTPLHVAAELGYVGVCRRLLEEAIDLEARDVMDRTALHLAADKGHLEVVKALLEGGAKADVLDHDAWSPRQSAEFRGFMEIAAELAKGHSITKEGESATQGASATLPPAPWHTEIFAQVRLSAARQRKLEAIAAAREEVYAKYADIYKDNAAERYARAIDASRRERGGLEAYRRRVVAASADAERYRGYVETSTPRDPGGNKAEEREEGESDRGPGPLLLEDGGSIPSDVFASSSNDGEGSGGSGSGLERGESTVAAVPPNFLLPTNRGSAVNGLLSKPGAPAIVGKGGGIAAEDGPTGVWRGDGAGPPEGSAALALGVGGFVEGGHPPGATRKGQVGTDGGGGGRSSFVDVVPFNNIRAKYLRPLGDTGLSRPYHVAPSPCWRAEAASRSLGSLGSSVCDSSTSAPTNNAAAGGVVAANKRTLEAYRKLRQRVPGAHRRRGKTLNRKERRDWGAD
eukprot:g6012.t2